MSSKTVVFHHSDGDRKFISALFFVQISIIPATLFFLYYSGILYSPRIIMISVTICFTFTFIWVSLLSFSQMCFIRYSELTVDEKAIQFNARLSRIAKTFSQPFIGNHQKGFDQDWRIEFSNIKKLVLSQRYDRIFTLKIYYKADSSARCKIFDPQQWYPASEKSPSPYLLAITKKPAQLTVQGATQSPFIRHLQSQGIEIKANEPPAQKWKWHLHMALMVITGVFVTTVLFSEFFANDYKTWFAPEESSTVHSAKPEKEHMLPYKEKLVFRKHAGNVIAVAFHPDGKSIISGGTDQQIKHWNVENGEIIREIISGDEDQQIKHQNVENGEVIREWAHDDTIQDLAFSPDGKYIASASEDGTVKLWDTKQGKELHTFNAEGKANTGYKDFLDVEFSPDGTLLAGANWNGNTIIWTVSNYQRLFLLPADSKNWLGYPAGEFPGHSNSVDALAFSPDGQYIATAGFDNLIKIWRVSDGQFIRNLEGHRDWVHDVAYSPDSSLIASSGQDRTVRLWNSETGKLIYTISAHQRNIPCINFSPDGQVLISSSDDFTAKYWEVSSGALLQTLNDHSDFVNRAVFSANGRLLATASGDDTVRLWQIPQ